MTGKTSWRPLLWLSLATVFPGNGQALRAKDGHPKTTPIACPESITFPTGENFLSSFKASKLVFKSQSVQTQTISQTDLLRQSSAQSLKNLSFRAALFTSMLPFNSSAGSLIVSGSDTALFYFIRIVQVKVLFFLFFFCGPKTAAVVQAGFWKEVCVCVQKEKVLGQTSPFQIVSEVQAF